MLFARLGSTADRWCSRLEKPRQAGLLGRYFAAKRERLREVACYGRPSPGEPGQSVHSDNARRRLFDLPPAWRYHALAFEESRKARGRHGPGGGVPCVQDPCHSNFLNVFSGRGSDNNRDVLPGMPPYLLDNGRAEAQLNASSAVAEIHIPALKKLA